MRTRRGPSSPLRSASGRSGRGTIPRAHRRLGSWAAVGCHERWLSPEVCGYWVAWAGFAQSAPGPTLQPQTASGGRPRAAVPSTWSRTTPRSGGLSPGWTERGPATAHVPSRSPLAPSESASDTSGMSCGKMILDRGFGPWLRSRLRLRLQVTSLAGASTPSLARCQTWVS